MVRNPQHPEVPTISAEEAFQRLGSDSPTERPIVVDVREPDEWVQGHIEGALFIPLGELMARHKEVPTDRDVVVVCHMGSRSAMATAWLLRHGYDRAINLSGGMDSWEGHNFPIVTGQ